jgi:hypothetical protein
MKKPSRESQPWAEDVIHRFSTRSRSGYEPEGGLILDPNGNLYGTTYLGNDGSLRGSVFNLKHASGRDDSWAFGALHGFAGIPDGENPTGALIFDRSSNLYGTTQYGGTGTGCSFTGCGTVFGLAP